MGQAHVPVIRAGTENEQGPRQLPFISHYPLAQMLLLQLEKRVMKLAPTTDKRVKG